MIEQKSAVVGVACTKRIVAKRWRSRRVTKNLAQKIARKTRGDHLKGRHWQRFARECGLNPKQVLDRVAALAKSAIAEVGAAESEVAAMPAGLHPILIKLAWRSSAGLSGPPRTTARIGKPAVCGSHRRRRRRPVEESFLWHIAVEHSREDGH
jgi:hypothetical protein